MNYIDKMNSIMKQSHQLQECVSGLCEHPEHKVNALIWIIPMTVGAYLVTVIYKKYFG
jgi:hypothetical protein